MQRFRFLNAKKEVARGQGEFGEGGIDLLSLSRLGRMHFYREFLLTPLLI